MKATVSKSGVRKLERALALGWTRRETVGPCKFLRLSALERRDMRRGGGR